MDKVKCKLLKDNICLAGNLKLVKDFSYLCCENNYCALKRLQAENERLKKISCKYKAYCTCDTEKFIQALQEIRDICKMDCGDCEYNQDCDCNFSECEESKIDDILDKINEVIGAE